MRSRSMPPRSSAAAPCAGRLPAEVVTVVERLLRHSVLLARANEDRDGQIRRGTSAAALMLADAVIRTGGLVPKPGEVEVGGSAAPPHTTINERPFQIAVIGPTQTGKSTIVNLVLGCTAAGVSPLAGYTIHPQGFLAIGDPLAADQALPTASGGSLQGGLFEAQADNTYWLSDFFPGFDRVAPEELDREDLAQYTLTLATPPATLTLLPPFVVWDAPDFDSLSAGAYERSVLELAAAADLHVVVLSKEKYSDLSVWQTLQLVAPLGRPLLIVLNKMTPEATEIVVRSLRERCAALIPHARLQAIVTIDYAPEGIRPDADAAAALRGEIATWLAATANQSAEERLADRARGFIDFAQAHWDEWLVPVKAEHAALHAWRALIDSAVADFVSAYQRDYLDHPQRFDSFRRASVELLNLMELPKIGSVLVRIREVVTWPARQALLAGRTWFDAQRGSAATDHPLHKLGIEADVLVEASDGLLTALQRDVARRGTQSGTAGAFWRRLGERLSAEELRLRGVFTQAIQVHHDAVTREIRATADRLFEELRKQPARLAALRTARATVDVGYMVLAVKTAGLSMMDVIWAPATFALTSLVVEAATGIQMNVTARDLKIRQLERVRAELADRVLVDELRRVADELLLAEGTGIQPAEVLAATAALQHSHVGMHDG